MIPAIGPSSAEYPMSQLKMYVSAVARNFHGIITMPSTPVITPPILKLISRGARLAKSFAGLTTFAAMFTEMVATATPNSATIATSSRTPALSISGSSMPGGGTGDVRCERITTGSHSFEASTPCNSDCDALVITTPIAENSDHRGRQPERLPQHLLALAFPEAREVRNVERERRPEADHPGERGNEHLPELAHRGEARGLLQHRPHAARAVDHPDEQRGRHHQHQRRGPVLEHPHRVHPAAG